MLKEMDELLELMDMIISNLKEQRKRESALSDRVMKPCPHCGDQPEIRKRKTVIIECKGCGALFIKMEEGEAIEAWNKRRAL